MIKPDYPKLTPKNAAEAAEVYMMLKRKSCPVVRTTDLVNSSTDKNYRWIFQALLRLEDNKIIDSRHVGDAGRVWWLCERLS